MRIDAENGLSAMSCNKETFDHSAYIPQDAESNMRIEILVASLKPDYREDDLAAIIRWNTDYHREHGVTDVHYFVSEDRKSFVMTASHEDVTSDKLAKEWDDSGTENEKAFQDKMKSVFINAKSTMFHEVQP